ncbi:helix-turn-helix domain-containing protein [uncultured Ruegeria sp.]|uniref:helix-turn-helix domain-containing protein n=1 Tax=uncultured Ruegeria sp. TaxID=259304 RepID=UPI00261C7F2D|nr:XRE family transcriptional regulator [uncultured Ruegeria sp.]
MRDMLTGCRIRERRQIAGLRQAELARLAGISASYLNLIEHNRRRIGGKLLVDIASALAVEPSVLTRGIEATLVSALREAADDAIGQKAEVDGLEEFAGRFPGWAGVLAQMHRRVVSLERNVETLSDRLTHDPHLAASMHEVLSTAAAIRSTAAILADTKDIEAEWRERFHKNLHQDAERLAGSSKALVTFLDESDSAVDPRGVPLEEVEGFIKSRGYSFSELEEGEDVDAVDLSSLNTSSARAVAREFLNMCRADARALPLDALRSELGGQDPDPVELAHRFSVDVATVLRRLAVLPDDILAQPVGMALCDASGSILFLKPIPGFALSRHGEVCPLWPLFTALSRPLVPVRKQVIQMGRASAEFECFAYAWPYALSGYDQEPAYRSVMMVRPIKDVSANTPITEVGSNCRVCPSNVCKARREPSILSEGF